MYIYNIYIYVYIYIHIHTGIVIPIDELIFFRGVGISPTRLSRSMISFNVFEMTRPMFFFGFELEVKHDSVTTISCCDNVTSLYITSPHHAVGFSSTRMLHGAGIFTYKTWQFLE